MLGIEMASEGGAVASGIQLLGNIRIAVTARHLTNPRHGVRGSFQRSFPGGRPLDRGTRDRSGTPPNLDFYDPRLGNTVQLYRFNGHAQQLLSILIGRGLRFPKSGQIPG
jgi:hypothetical protein